MPRGELISLGSINVDVQLRAPRLPSSGETQPARDLLLPGGKAANAAFLAR
jgi:sugar/nucleoside kinase (ribokinase family)